MSDPSEIWGRAILGLQNGSMVALWARQQQGVGQNLEIALLDSLLHLQAPLLGRYFLMDDIPPRIGWVRPRDVSISPGQAP